MDGREDCVCVFTTILTQRREMAAWALEDAILGEGTRWRLTSLGRHREGIKSCRSGLRTARREPGKEDSGNLDHNCVIRPIWVSAGLGGVIVLFSSYLCCSSISVSCSILNIINDFIASCLSLPILHSFHRTKFQTFLIFFEILNHGKMPRKVSVTEKWKGMQSKTAVKSDFTSSSPADRDGDWWFRPGCAHSGKGPSPAKTAGAAAWRPHLWVHTSLLDGHWDKHCSRVTGETQRPWGPWRFLWGITENMMGRYSAAAKWINKWRCLQDTWVTQSWTPDVAATRETWVPLVSHRRNNLAFFNGNFNSTWGYVNIERSNQT